MKGATFTELSVSERDDGTWAEGEPCGVFFETAVLRYTLYPAVFPLWALAAYEARRRRRVLPSVRATHERAA